MRVKAQLEGFARGSRYLLNTPSNVTPHSPYGDGWDILWVGLCHDSLPTEGDTRIYQIANDPSVPNIDKLHMNNPDMLQPFPSHTRLIHMANEPICTFGYALSRQGALKLMYSLSVKELRGIFDNALMWWCQDHNNDPKCISANPTYFYQHRFAGGPGKSSDINPDFTVAKGETYNIRWSTRLNIEKLLKGDQDYHDGYPD